MATFTRGKTFAVDETVTNTKLHQLVDNGSISDIVRADFNSVTSPVTASASALSTPQTGEIWFDTANVKMKVYNGTVWTEFSEFPWQHTALVVNITSNTVVTCEVGSTFRDSANTKEMSVTGSAQTADITTAGKGGLDSGSEASNTWYAFLIIEDSTGVNAQDTLLVAAANYPDSITYPTGYDLHRRVCWVRNNASSNFLYGHMYGGQFTYADAQSVQSALNSTSFTDISCTAAAPTTADAVELQCHEDAVGDNIERSVYVTTAGITASTGGRLMMKTENSNTFSIADGKDMGTLSNVYLNSSQQFAARTGSANAVDDISVTGYTDKLAD